MVVVENERSERGGGTLAQVGQCLSKACFHEGQVAGFKEQRQRRLAGAQQVSNDHALGVTKKGGHKERRVGEGAAVVLKGRVAATALACSQERLQRLQWQS